MISKQPIRLIALVAIAFSVSFTSFGQSNTSATNEESLPTQQNFRKYAPFLSKINLRNPDFETMNACLFFAVNEQRTKRSLPILDYQESLECTAFYHSKSMAENDFFSHVNPNDANRADVNQRGKLAGILNPFLSECIAETSGGAYTCLQLCDYFLNLWMNSPTHKKIILSKDALSLGGSFSINKQYNIYATINTQSFKPLYFDSSVAVDHLPYQTLLGQ